ncbi:hypothetical protein [Corynebacterium sp. AOP34-BR1-29]|uniref:hypothetical protein n=1 Tax=Corynebacterium sp. AOP34-BR1-29 TaxID=3457688 RepID=UPI0040339A53
MAVYLRLFPKPYIHMPKDEADYRAFYVDPSRSFEDVREQIESADADDEIVVKVMLPDLAFPVPFGFRKADWSAWMVHPLPADEAGSG